MEIKRKGQNIRLPDLLIVGAAKSGTTTLAHFLSQHPDVTIPRKEPGFFAYHKAPESEIPSDLRQRQVTEEKDYLDLYKGLPKDKFLVDASTAYLTCAEQSIRNIRNFYGEASAEVKIVIILRHPVERAFSNYLMLCKNGFETLSFNEAIQEKSVQRRVARRKGFNYLGNSMYAERTRMFTSNFPKVRIYLTEDLKKADALWEDLREFCGLSNEASIRTDLHLNPSGMPKNAMWLRWLNRKNGLKRLVKELVPPKYEYRLQQLKAGLVRKAIQPVRLDEETKQRLMPYFRDDILQTQKLIHRDLSHWLKE